MWATLHVSIFGANMFLWSHNTLYPMLSLNHADNYHNNDNREIWRPYYLRSLGNKRWLAVKP